VFSDHTEAYAGILSAKQGEWRLAYFRRQLYEITYKQYLKTRADIKFMSPDLYADMGLDSDQEEMTSWPEFYNVDEVPKLLRTELKQKPKLKYFTSMEAVLQDYNIRDQLDRKMIELDSQNGSKARSASVGPVREGGQSMLS